MNLVFDLGATHTRLAWAEQGKLGDWQEFETDPGPAGLKTFLDQLKQFVANRKFKAVGGGIAAQFDTAGRLAVVTNLPGWRNVPLAAEIERVLAVPAIVRNDIVMCGIGEAQAGAGEPKGVTVYITVSTGVNAVRLIDGWPDESIERFELGYQVVSGGPEHPASLESLIGGRSIRQRLGEAPAAVEDPRFWAQTGQYLARAIYNLELYWNPRLVVVGGSMMRDIGLAQVQHDLEALPQVLGEPVELRPARLGDRAGLLGAMKYLENQH